jgi:hypothetical protein
MRALAIIVAAVGMGCASPQPSTYEKGAYRPLPARTQPRVGPSFQPGAPAPQVEPAPRPPPVPHTPKTRREPTIWASNEPDAQPNILGVPPPVPEGATDERPVPFAYCVHSMNRALDKTDFRKFILAHPNKGMQRCFAAQLYLACAELPFRPERKAEPADAQKRARSAAAALVSVECKAPLDGALGHAKRQVIEAWEQGVKELDAKGSVR